MIFVTVGTQLPFDRLVHLMDAWAARHPDRECFAQVGTEGEIPVAMPSTPTLSASECRERIAGADCVVSHAGMGTILTCRDLGVPLVVVPRRHELGEARSDHQRATAAALRELQGLYVLEGGAALDALLDEALHAPRADQGLAHPRLETLRSGLAAWLDGGNDALHDREGATGLQSPGLRTVSGGSG